MDTSTDPKARSEEPRRRGRLRRRKLLLVLTLSVAVLLLAALAGLGWVTWQVRGSLPQLDGSVSVTGLAAPVTIERDALGVPSIRGEDRADVAFGTGYAHAQDRFFQMDLLRRRAAGELAELFGRAGLSSDRNIRRHRLRVVASRVVETSSPEIRAMLQSYAQGVNAGLRSLDANPPEYLLLRTDPRPWTPEDCVLVLLSMFLQLQNENASGEWTLAMMQDALAPELFDFLTPRGSEWDAPLVGEAFETPPIPGPEVLDLRENADREVAQRPGPTAPAPPLPEPELPAASNAWAVGGGLTPHGAALLANELHLDLSVPNIWYRAAFLWPAGESSAPHRVVGATLPGTPVMVLGSNGHLAWGYSNSVVDAADSILLELDPDDPDVYRTPEGPRQLQHHSETLRVRGAEDEVLDVRWTHWGPVIGPDPRGRPRAVKWVAHHPGAVDFRALRLETARTVDEALGFAHASGVPVLNVVLADSRGHVAWTLIGKVPRRVGLTGLMPTSWADGGRRWDGLLAAGELPAVVDPPSHRVWTANNRLVEGEALERLGRGGFGYLFGARAHQIREDLFALDRATVEDMRRIQTDDRAVLLQRWHDVLLDVLDPEALTGHPQRQEFRRLVESWEPRAAVDSVGYRMVRTFRVFLALDVFAALTAPVVEIDPDFQYPAHFSQFEGPLWKLVTERPRHLLRPEYESWDHQMVAAVDQAVEYLIEEDGEPLRDRTWGERNTTSIRHVLSPALPEFVSQRLDMAPRRLPGDQDMPRVQHPSHGSSLRMVVAPGREEEGVFTMPAGQSGHPLSPHYRDGHEAWAAAAAAPLLPGQAARRLVLVPEGR